ncbi:hypothetical protein FRC20_009618 [Serendipita sp. 405]|nr:hypothetical protein FRC15_009763 [Serendipita sp. 397]KAG8865658.1 hypothetical protein FRC20_009618 [Serendipita sp. 405]
MAHFRGFEGNLVDTTPLKLNMRRDEDDLSISELSTTPQIRWMGDAGPATEDSQEGEEDQTTSSWNAKHGSGTLEQSFDESMRLQDSALNDEAEGSVAGTPRRKNNQEEGLLELRDSLRRMNRTVTALTGLLQSTIPEYQRMSRAIDSWDKLSKQYNQIMIETEKTAQILEDPTWLGQEHEETRYKQKKEEEEERRQQEELEREIRKKQREQEKIDQELKRKENEERAAKQTTTASRGRGRGRGTLGSSHVSTGSLSGRGIPRVSMIARGASASVSSRGSSSISGRGSVSSVRGRYAQ